MKFARSLSLLAILLLLFAITSAPASAYYETGNPQIDTYSRLGEAIGNAFANGAEAYRRARNDREAKRLDQIRYLNQSLGGSCLYAFDGTVLGYWLNEYDPLSLFNKFGEFGSKFNIKCVFNEFTQYGGCCDDMSAYSETAQHPPVFAKDRQMLCFLSVNPIITPRIDPRIIFPDFR